MMALHNNAPATPFSLGGRCASNPFPFDLRTGLFDFEVNFLPQPDGGAALRAHRRPRPV